MHILIIPSEHFMTERVALGGVFQLEQAKALVRAGHQVGIIGVGFVSLRYLRGGYPYRMTEHMSGVFVMRKYRRIFLPHKAYGVSVIFRKYVRIFERQYKEYIKERGVPKVIHAHNSLFAGVVAAYMKRKYGIPFVLTEHSSAYARGMVSARLIERLRPIYEQANVVTCVSKSFSVELEKIFKTAVPVLHNVVDAIFVQDGAKVRANEQFHLLSVGSLDNNKNHALALKAFASAFREQNVSLTIVGDGPLRGFLSELSHTLGIGQQVKFLGQLTRNEVRKEMGQADCLVLSSNYETFGVVVIEALACGLPVVATRCGGPNEIISPSNGLLVDIGDEEQMAAAMLFIRDNHHSYDAETIRKDASARFGEQQFVSNVMVLYERALGGHSLVDIRDTFGHQNP